MVEGGSPAGGGSIPGAGGSGGPEGSQGFSSAVTDTPKAGDAPRETGLSEFRAILPALDKPALDERGKPVIGPRDSSARPEDPALLTVTAGLAEPVDDTPVPVNSDGQVLALPPGVTALPTDTTDSASEPATSTVVNPRAGDGVTAERARVAVTDTPVPAELQSDGAAPDGHEAKVAALTERAQHTDVLAHQLPGGEYVPANWGTRKYQVSSEPANVQGDTGGNETADAANVPLTRSPGGELIPTAWAHPPKPAAVQIDTGALATQDASTVRDGPAQARVRTAEADPLQEDIARQIANAENNDANTAAAYTPENTTENTDIRDGIARTRAAEADGKEGTADDIHGTRDALGDAADADATAGTRIATNGNGSGYTEFRSKYEVLATNQKVFTASGRPYDATARGARTEIDINAQAMGTDAQGKILVGAENIVDENDNDVQRLSATILLIDAPPFVYHVDTLANGAQTLTLFNYEAADGENPWITTDDQAEINAAIANIDDLLAFRAANEALSTTSASSADFQMDTVRIIVEYADTAGTTIAAVRTNSREDEGGIAEEDRVVSRNDVFAAQQRLPADENGVVTHMPDTPKSSEPKTKGEPAPAEPAQMPTTVTKVETAETADSDDLTIVDPGESQEGIAVGSGTIVVSGAGSSTSDDEAPADSQKDLYENPNKTTIVRLKIEEMRAAGREVTPDDIERFRREYDAKEAGAKAAADALHEALQNNPPPELIAAINKNYVNAMAEYQKNPALRARVRALYVRDVPRKHQVMPNGRPLSELSSAGEALLNFVEQSRGELTQQPSSAEASAEAIASSDPTLAREIVEWQQRFRADPGSIEEFNQAYVDERTHATPGDRAQLDHVYEQIMPAEHRVTVAQELGRQETAELDAETVVTVEAGDVNGALRTGEADEIPNPTDWIQKAVAEAAREEEKGRKITQLAVEIKDRVIDRILGGDPAYYDRVSLQLLTTMEPELANAMTPEMWKMLDDAREPIQSRAQAAREETGMKFPQWPGPETIALQIKEEAKARQARIEQGEKGRPGDVRKARRGNRLIKEFVDAQQERRGVQGGENNGQSDGMNESGPKRGQWPQSNPNAERGPRREDGPYMDPPEENGPRRLEEQDPRPDVQLEALLDIMERREIARPTGESENRGRSLSPKAERKVRELQRLQEEKPPSRKKELKEERKNLKKLIKAEKKKHPLRSKLVGILRPKDLRIYELQLWLVNDELHDLSIPRKAGMAVRRAIFPRSLYERQIAQFTGRM